MHDATHVDRVVVEPLQLEAVQRREEKRHNVFTIDLRIKIKPVPCVSEDAVEQALTNSFESGIGVSVSRVVFGQPLGRDHREELHPCAVVDVSRNECVVSRER